MKSKVLWGFAVAVLVGVACLRSFSQAASPASEASSGVVKQLGSISKIEGSELTLTTDQGPELAVKVQSGARILRLAPGQTDLKSAAAIQLSDLQPGDRVLVRGKGAADGSVAATAIVVMKQQDIAQRKRQELLDWQRRSIGGVVKQVDSQTGSITLSVNTKTVVVSTTPNTTIKRYSPDSVKWEDATNAKFADIRPGDQLRAKGNKNEDGSQLAAEEIVDGTFRNISGLVTAIDPSHGTLTVQDLATKAPVTVTVTTESQMKKLPPQLAQGLAMRLKGGTPPEPSAPPAGMPANAPHARAGDLNQMLSRLPAATLADLQKGEAVMIVSTLGSAARPPAAITLLAGVEPILTAAPSGRAAQSFLTPWSLASAPSGEQ